MILCILLIYMFVMAKFTKLQAEEKIFRLTEQLISVKQDKKDMVAGYTEKIKDIQSEIEAIIEEQNSVNDSKITVTSEDGVK